MPSVVITLEDAQKAKAKLLELMDLPDDRGRSVQAKAASDLIRLYQAQERYFAAPETTVDYERALGHRGSMAQQLERTTPEDIFALQRKMLEGDPDRPRRRPKPA